MNDKRSAPDSVDEIVDRIRQEVAQRKSQLDQRSATSSSSGARSQPSSLHVEPPNIQQLPEHEGHIEPKSRYLLQDFLKFHDIDFVTNAYYGILRRPPDNKGLNDFLNAYREGKLSKLEILGRLRFSKEGRAQRVQVRGLLPLFTIQTAYHIPLIGYLIALVASVVRMPIILKQSQQFEAFAVSQHSQQIKSLNSLGQQLYRQHFALAQNAARLDERLDHFLSDTTMSNTVAELQTALLEVRERIDRAVADKAEAKAVAELGTGLVDLGKRLEGLVILGEQIRGLLNLSERMEELVNLGERLDGALGHKAEINELTEVARQVADQRRIILDQDRRLSLLFGELRKRLPEEITIEQIKRVLPEEEHLMDAFYVSFEDRFRGTREDIKHRVAVYLPFIEDAVAGTDSRPILDIGCGRGEWLELLKEHGLTARGLDYNKWMVAQCREMGLDVIQGEAVEHLRSLARDSFSAITGMHIVEHLPFTHMIALFDEVLRVLKPGGIAIFETPNPENLIVAACNFYCDPTHLKPIPPPTIQFIAEARGFVRTRIERLNAAVLTNPFRGIHASSIEEIKVIRNLLENTYFGAPDYALIMYKA